MLFSFYWRAGDLNLIVIEGIDASGKTTQALQLKKFLEEQKGLVCLRIHPSDDNWLGNNASRFLKSKGRSAHFTSAFFYMLDVFYSIGKYSWQNYDYFIFVRYLMGTAYLPSPMDKVLYWFFSKIVPKAKKKFFIDINPEIAYKRLISREKGSFEMFENKKAFNKIRKKGLELAFIDNWLIVNGEKTAKEVQSSIQNLL